MKINSQRLSRYITSIECISTTDRLIEMYDRLSVAQRLEIKLLLHSNANKLLLNRNAKIYNK